MSQATITRSAMRTVRILSIWSKRLPSDPPVAYNVQVPAAPGDSAEETLNAAFVATNIDHRPHSKIVCSTSCGDLMVLDGQNYLVEGVGFRAVTPEDAAKISALSSRDVSSGYDRLKAEGLI